MKHKVNLLIDSGSSLNVLRESVVKNLNLINKFDRVVIFGLNTVPINSIGSLSLIHSRKSISFDFNFQILSDNDISLSDKIHGILGMNFIDRCILDFCNRKLYTYNTRYAFPLIKIDDASIQTIDYFPNEIREYNSVSNPYERLKILRNSVNLSHLDENSVKTLNAIIFKYSNAFYIENDAFRACKIMEHKIFLKQNSEPCFTNQFPLAPAVKSVMEQEIKKMLDMDIIEECTHSAFNSPAFMVKKGNNKWRFVIDMKNVNKLIIPNKYSIPSPDDIISRIHGAKIFSRLDLKSAFYQQALSPESRHITAFSFMYKRYQLKRVVMGMTDSSASFSQMLALVLNEFLGKFVENFIDDLIIYSNTLSDHLKHLALVFKKLSENNLKIEINKSDLIKSKIDFIGYEISHKRIELSRKNVQAILDIPIPDTHKKLESLIGCFGFSSKFIDNYSQLVRPLYDVLKNKSRFCLTKEAIEAIQMLKNKVSSKPVIHTPNFHLPFIVRTDASLQGISATLFQLNDLNQECPIMFFSRKLKDTETRYSAFELEYLAIVEAISRKFYKYVLNSEILVLTDCYSVCCSHANGLDSGASKIIRYKLKLLPYNVKMAHIPGKKNLTQDFLSRTFKCPEKSIAVESNDAKIEKSEGKVAFFKSICSSYPITRAVTKKINTDWKKEYEKFVSLLQDRSLVKKSKICNITNCDLDLNSKSNTNIFFCSKLGENLNADARKIFSKLSSFDNISKYKNNIFIIYKDSENHETDPKGLFILMNELKTFMRQDKSIKNTLQIHCFNDKNFNLFELYDMISYVFKNDNYYFKLIKSTVRFLSDEDEISEVIRENHENKCSGHSGASRTMTRIKEFYKFNDMKDLIKKFIKTCKVCQLNKISIKTPNVQRITSNPKNRNEIVALDIVGPLPVSENNNKYILTICDTLTRHLTTVPIPNCESNTIVKAFTEKYLLIYSCPRILLSDNAQNFKSDIIKEFCEYFKIKKFFSTPYRPQSNGILERSHQELKKYIRCYLENLSVDNWESLLPLATFNFNTHANVSLYSPHELTFGSAPQLPHEDVFNVIDDSYDYSSYLGKLKSTLTSLHNRTKDVLNEMKKKRVDKHNIKAIKMIVKVGQKVKLLNRFQGQGAKLYPRYLGPFIVTKIHSPEYISIDINGTEKKYNLENVYPYYSEDDEQCSEDDSSESNLNE